MYHLDTGTIVIGYVVCEFMDFGPVVGLMVLTQPAVRDHLKCL